MCCIKSNFKKYDDTFFYFIARILFCYTFHRLSIHPSIRTNFLKHREKSIDYRRDDDFKSSMYSRLNSKTLGIHSFGKLKNIDRYEFTRIHLILVAHTPHGATKGEEFADRERTRTEFKF